jgi:NADPH:quinone reductase-like Zn-dependent oxidoreductase
MYPGASGLLGSECSGRVVAIGAEVGSIRVGDEVVAIAPGAFATYVIARASLAVPKPRALSFAEAAALPNVLLTADWALNRLGRLQAGERVLIHAAAGGVGLAAVRLAQRVGAEIFATAGSERKRAYLRSLGLKHVFDSRTLDFATAIYELTNGRGVDLVLNSLAGDFIGASFAAMAPGGRFLEIGRTDIWSPDRVRETHPLAQYHVIDLGKDYEATPEIIRPMLQSLLEDVVAGRLAPLPLQTFPLAAATDAFRVMAQARHIGKIVVTQPWDPPTSAGVLRPEGSYLITGGLVGLGLAVADWMVEQGARHLVLLGRRAPAADATAAMDRMSGRGARILSLQCDALSVVPAACRRGPCRGKPRRRCYREPDSRAVRKGLCRQDRRCLAPGTGDRR